MRPLGVHPLYYSAHKYRPPAEWNIQSIKDYATLTKGKMPTALLKEPTPNSLPYLLIDGLGEGETLHTEETNLPTIDVSDTAVVADGSRSGLAIRGVRGVLGSTLLAYRAKEGFYPDYLFYILESLYPYNNTATIGGAIPHLDKRLLAKLKLATPEEDEQRRIAAALKLADDAIAKTKAELKATRDLKRTMMHTLFVSGMPGRHSEFVETKIGRIPEGWQVKRVKEVLVDKPINGYSPQSNPEPPGTKTLNVACIRHGECDIVKATYVDIDDSVIDAFQVMKGDFFVLRGNGNRDYIGIGGIVRDDIQEPMIYSDLLFRLRFDESESVPLYIPYMWQSLNFLHRLQAKAKSGSGLWKIGKRDIEKEILALPSKDEQSEIVEVIESVTASYMAIEKRIEALQQVKKSLLQNLLTGKIRIPEGVIYG
jgi:type I restriction enzyme S subunit